MLNFKMPPIKWSQGISVIVALVILVYQPSLKTTHCKTCFIFNPVHWLNGDLYVN